MKNWMRIVALVVAVVIVLGTLVSCGGPTVEINEDGYWVINGEVTEYRAIAQDGKDGKDGKDGADGANGTNGTNGTDGVTPEIEINEDGYWVINGEVTDVLAEGKDGKDGKDGEDGEDGTNGKNGISPTISINSEGFWVIDGVTTNWLAGKQVEKYTVTVGGMVVAQYIEGSKIELPAYTPADGYKITGWTVNGTAWDFENDTIQENIILTPVETLDLTPLSADNVQSATLKSVVAGKIKQCDQATLDDGSNNHANGWFTKEGGTPVYVTAKKNGADVEALYFSRSEQYDWTTYADKDQNTKWFEYRFDTKGKIKSFSFDYIAKGTTAASTETGVWADGTVVPLGHSHIQVKTVAEMPNGGGDNYGELPDSALITDGQWHTFTVTFDEAIDSTNILIKFQQFIGEHIIANFNVVYE